MAQLKDLLVSGSSRLIGKLFANEVQLTTLNIPTASNGTTYGPGTSGQVLATNNNSVYWKSLTIADIGGSTVLPISLGGTGATVATKGGVVYGTGTTYGLTAAGTSGYLLQSGGTGAPTWINATNANTASTIVKRDASGNFSAGTITATLSGNASTANALNFSHSNELFLGVNGTNQTRVWINYRRTIGGATSGNTAITEYRFGNGNAGTSGVTLYADSFTGNAATATAFSSGATVTLTGDVTGQSAASTKSWSIATTLKNSGATAGSYGQSAAATLAHSGKFKVPYITVDAKGIVTSISEKEITLPASGNTDANVSQTITTGDADYRILFSGTADDTTRTEGARKGTNLRYNPSTSEIKMVNGTLWVQGGSNAGSSSATNRLTLTNGMPANLAYNTSKRGTRIYSNGIAFADPYNGNSNNDSGWIRQIEETANSGTLEIATGDDSNETIVVRQYNTSSAVTGEITLLNSSHQTLLNTTLPRANATYDLGSSSVKWSNVYATNFKGTADSALTANKLGTNAGSATQPVYFDGGIPKAATAYSGLLTAFSLSTNTLSLTVGGTTKTASAISSVSNTWTDGTTSGPTIKTTVNGVASSAVAIPSASASASGIITTGPQTIAGDKTFNSQVTVIGHNVIRSDTQGPDQGDILLGALGFKTGYPVYTDPTFLSGNDNVGVYNNTSGGNVVHTRDTYTNFGITSPGTNSNYVIRIQTKGAASPGIGGFVQSISSRANAVFIQIFRALIPVGRNVQTASNSMGTSYRDQWLTSQAGTGKWEWYARRVICGKEGTFSSGGHVYLDGAAGTSSAPVTWYLAACNVYDITRMEYDGLRTRYSDSATSATTASKSTAANITTTTNSVAYFTDTAGTFGNRASANGALYATSANGALQWGTLPIAQGGTSLTSNPSLLVNLGSTNAATVFQASPRPGITGTLPVAHGGTGATTAANARTNLGLGSIATETATNYFKWQTTTTGLDSIYDFGVYVNMNNAAGSSMTGGNYFNILSIPYRKASGNTKPDWGFQIGNTTSSDSRLWYRTSGADNWNDWQTIAHATQSTNNTGGPTQPVYMTSAGVLTPCTSYENASVASATNATNATNANNLLQNTRMDYGWSGINYFNISAANQSQAKVNDTPSSSAVWWHILRFNHANNAGYYTDLAVPFNANSLYYKRIAGGTLQNSTTNGGWVQVLDQLNYTTYTVTKTGTGASGTWGISITGNATTATTANKLGSGNVGSATQPVYFANGIPVVTSGVLSSQVYDSKIQFGNDNFAGSAGVIDTLFNNKLRGNRFAGFKPAGTTIEYSTDGGSTWTNYGASDTTKQALFTTNTSLRLVPSGNVTANSQLRIIMDTGAGWVYTVLRKIMIYVSTNYSSNCTVTIEAALQNAPTNYTLKICENQPIAGWSGWNVIQCNFTTYGNTATSQYGRIRFTFKHSGVSSGHEAQGLIVQSIYGYGGMGWTTPSTLALTDHVYSYDQSLNTTFPAQVTATQFNGSLNGTATKATQDDSGNTITSTYVKKAGDSMTGNLTANGSVTLGTPANPWHQLVLGGTTNATMTADSTNPRITFQENTGTQPVHLIYCDWDGYRSPAGLKIIGGASATPAWFEVEGNIYAAAFKGTADVATKLGISNVGSTYVPIFLNGGTAQQCTSPSLQVNLASTNAANVFAQSPRPGVTGVLGATNGGTGKDNLKDACNALINALETGSSTLTANDYIITQYVGGGTTTTTYHRRPASAVRVGGLLTGRSLKVALNSTTAVTFNGTADVNNIPVTGTLGIAHGGTGQTSAAGVFSALSWIGGTSAGPTLSATVVGQTRTATIPSASASASGVITTGAQTIAGAKTLSNTLTIKGLKATSGTDYGTTLPTSGTEGQVFFQISDEQYEIPVGGNTGALLMKASATDRDVTWTPSAIHVTGSVLYGAAWNDYAEYRKTETKIEAGRVVIENGDDTLSLSTERMQPGAEIVSDTFGFAIGQTKNTQTPIAVSGRVLAYPNEPRKSYKPGQPVCSGPNGTVSQMTNEEAREYPWLIIGTVSAIPDYDTWGEDNIKINGRIWIRIR